MAECMFIADGLGKHSKDGTIKLEYYVRSRCLVLRGSRKLVAAARRPLMEITLAYIHKSTGRKPDVRLPQGCKLQQMWRLPPQSDYIDNDRPIPFYMPLHFFLVIKFIFLNVKIEAVHYMQRIVM